jgi:hypothetical protein
MRYIVYKSADPSELNREFEADVPPRIGKVLSLRNGRTYKVMDIEYFQLPDRSTMVRGALQRVG